ncbi:hypothetical protein GcM3_074020 [Golovinomyces cichoracearum]|uniref:Secreted effector protein n=1 Tax=Golovinomyces cichoracearum TaxID=62708 RepID=A0A420IR59_9PEZI|nr:hypothetical protein GcM3_074020 [Golovinomyces cichoracearum]
MLCFLVLIFAVAPQPSPRIRLGFISENSEIGNTYQSPILTKTLLDNRIKEAEKNHPITVRKNKRDEIVAFCTSGRNIGSFMNALQKSNLMKKHSEGNFKILRNNQEECSKFIQENNHEKEIKLSDLTKRKTPCTFQRVERMLAARQLNAVGKYRCMWKNNQNNKVNINHDVPLPLFNNIELSVIPIKLKHGDVTRVVTIKLGYIVSYKEGEERGIYVPTGFSMSAKSEYRTGVDKETKEAIEHGEKRDLDETIYIGGLHSKMSLD